jgi:hypothetical protein
VQLAHLARAGLDDDVAQRDLAVAAQRDERLPRRTLTMVVPWKGSMGRSGEPGGGAGPSAHHLADLDRGVFADAHGA